MRSRRTRIALVALLAPLAAAEPAIADDAAQVRVRSMELLNEGVAAHKRGEHALAVEKLRASTSMALNSFRAHYYLGLALIGDRRYAEALEALEVALDLDPSHLQSHVAQGDALLKSGDLDEADASYFRALKIRPAHAAALDGLARVHEARGNDDQAIAHFRNAIQSDSGFAPAYTNLGDLYLRLSRVEEAVVLLEEAVTVRPDYAPGLNRLALAYGRLGLDNEAVATIQKAIGLEPNNASHVATLGELQLGLGFVDAAERSFARALELDPAHPEARLGTAEAARRRGSYDAAHEQVLGALADPRLDSRTSLRLLAFLERLEQEQGLVRQLEQALASGTASPEDCRALASIYAGRGLWQAAAELEQRAGDPSREARTRQAYLLFRAGRYGEALELYATLAAESPGAALELNRGVCLVQLGDDRAAVDAYRRALELEPGDLRARLYLGNALLRLGETDAAVATYTAYLDETRDGENAERVRRILRQIAPQVLPAPPAASVAPPAAPEPERKAGRT
jgi:tetratricopeptide (TPR) repeat protein